MIACPQCGSEDVNVLEISEVDENSVYECECCNAQFHPDEVVGG